MLLSFLLESFALLGDWEVAAGWRMLLVLTADLLRLLRSTKELLLCEEGAAALEYTSNREVSFSSGAAYEMHEMSLKRESFISSSEVCPP